ncbi:type II toxin-antitoxin system RelE/ParE family toxin [Bacillus sp. REN10]|uniref:type II toxin-antitoxin system RelE family toxin n=1 Tax=Bacillus sp. REN10 TaxID=2782541 RepID=UPI0031B5D4C9
MNSAYKLIYHKSAVKFIAKQEKAIQERIADGLKGLLEIPPEGDIKSMKGYENLYRLRLGTLGTFRILFEINHDEKNDYIAYISSVFLIERFAMCFIRMELK